MNLPITTRVAKARVGLTPPEGMEISMNADGSGGAVPERNSSPAKQMDNDRSKRRFARAEKVANKGRKAVDEGRDNKADRLLKRAARIEDRAIRTEEYENNYKPRNRKGVM